ncbi:MAG TPA: hypothetical protein VL354_16130 [Spirochaetia bacterium]|nr:hypothetical protein [Spirochaetia bacterium]
MDLQVHSAYFAGMKFDPPPRFGPDASILIVATPHRKSILVLNLPGGIEEAIVPATYLADRVNGKNNEVLASALGHDDRAFAPAVLPPKTLAAWTDLGAYGKDNVIRVPGMGSYARLDAWWVDADIGEAAWGEPKLIERCSSCAGPCIRACPNACFHEGSFYVDAARCLTFLNEGSPDFPEWLPHGAHSSAIGCLRCQDACPENARYTRLVERRFVYDERTSQAILEGKAADTLPSEAAQLIRLLELVA